MCGILGFKFSSESKFLKDSSWVKLLKKLYLFSESRGKEAAGIAIKGNGEIHTARLNLRASKFIKSDKFNNITNKFKNVIEDIAIIGHARLVTNGIAAIDINNQPVSRDGITLVHNGIVCNDQALWRKYPNLKRFSDLDSEVIPTYIHEQLKNGLNIEEAISSFYNSLEGDASLAMLFENTNNLVLTTNTGSIYYAKSLEGSVVFASEFGILFQLLSTNLAKKEFNNCEILRIKPKEILIIDLKQTAVKSTEGITNINSSIQTPALNRCNKCILPHTFPGITFDKKGICNICNNYVVFKEYGKNKLEELCNKYRKSSNEPDCIVALSGGRDSSYALHYLKKVMEMNPIAYTYDWGMITDLARRNISKLCGNLGVENILFSADIITKRENIRKNVEAWLKQPEIGMVTLFMAGDKEYFYHQKKIQKSLGIDLVFFGSNRLEQSGFKSAFCGIEEKNSWYFNANILQKAKMAGFFIKSFIKNPAYINSSLIDTLFSFYYALILKHNFTTFYDYITWDEDIIIKTLRQEYNWEIASDTATSWRIGDGTAAFYNYIYYKIAGFTEHDTFLSNQIRSGLIDRDKALIIAQNNNQPRFDSIKEYTDIIGIDFKKLISAINSMSTLY